MPPPLTTRQADGATPADAAPGRPSIERTETARESSVPFGLRLHTETSLKTTLVRMLRRIGGRRATGYGSEVAISIRIQRSRKPRLNSHRLSLTNMDATSDIPGGSINPYTYRLHEQARLDEAEALFRLLLVYDIRNVDYAIALGTVYQLRAEFDRAINIFGMAHAVSGNDARPLLHAGKCNLQAGRTDAARACFQRVIALGADPSRGARLADDADGPDVPDGADAAGGTDGAIGADAADGGERVRLRDSGPVAEAHACLAKMAESPQARARSRPLGSQRGSNDREPSMNHTDGLPP